MACNGHNHAPDCDCGWGGQWHGNVPYNGGGNYSLFEQIIRTYPVLTGGESRLSSYTDPNAICPVCGASVFFYQSPYGGRVFFDSLGPPWPKHPCTDNSSYPSEKILRPENDRTKRTGTAPWMAEGWEPFCFRRKPSGDLNIDHVEDWVILERRESDTTRLHSVTFQQGQSFSSIKESRFVFIREQLPRRGVYEISMWSESGETRRLGYANAKLRGTIEKYTSAVAYDQNAILALAKHLINQGLYEAALYWIEVLISEGVKEAFRLKAQCLENGWGCEKNGVEAHRLQGLAND